MTYPGGWLTGLLAGISAVLIFSGVAAAQEAVGEAETALSVVIAQYLVEEDPETGEEVLRPVEEAQPGDVLEYVVVSLNRSEGALAGVMVRGPIPEGVTLLDEWYEEILQSLLDKDDDETPPPVYAIRQLPDESARVVRMSGDQLPQFSLDGAKTFSRPPVYYEEDGVRKPATVNMFTDVGWDLNVLAPGEQVQVRYRVRID